MRRILLALALFSFAGASNAALVTVWDTFDGTPIGSGKAIGGSTNSVFALQFTPSATGYLADVTFGAWQYQGAADLNLTLNTASSGLPGSILETLTPLDVPPLPPGGNPVPTVTAMASQSTLITAGTTYWLVASIAPGSSVSWAVAEGGIVGTFAFSSNGGPFTKATNDSVMGADIRVETSPVPLPAGIWLLLSGAGGLAAFARRQSRS